MSAVDLERLQADADACLAFLIERQDEWKPKPGLDPRWTRRIILLATKRAAS